MSVLAIKQHLSQVKIATLGSLCQFLNCDPETLRCLLSHWIKKGKVRQCTKQAACGSRCFKCPVQATELYEWVEVV